MSRSINACVVASWATILRSAEVLRFTRVVEWGEGLWFCEFAHDGRRSRDIVIEADGRVWTKEECDV